jgi:O-acetyl-ADP-ribose deacetylase (regulator of RNase III)
MIIEVAGDLLLSKASAVAHCVAPNDDFHTGLALALRQRWPAMYKAFRHYCRLEHPGPGGIWAWKGPGTGVIYSLMAQQAAYEQGARPGKATTEALGKALAELRKACDREQHPTLALSRLATGVGGLEWLDVKPLIERHFADGPTRVYVYTTYHAGVAAIED